MNSSVMFFSPKNITNLNLKTINAREVKVMPSKEKSHLKKATIMSVVLRRAKKMPGSFIRATDFPEYKPAAVTVALFRLTEQQILQRASKGYYYYPKSTLLGPSRPSDLSIDLKVISGDSRPTRSTAAHILGLTTQVPARPEYLVVGRSIPSHVRAARLYKRKDMPQTPLTPLEGAWLEVVWDKGKYCELKREALLMAMLNHLRKISENSQRPGQLINTRGLRRMISAAILGPPRVRAVFGSMLAYIGQPEAVWGPIKKSLNPHTKFDFGPFAELPNAKEWQCR